MSKVLNEILEEYGDEVEFLKADGFDEAIIGVSAHSDPVLIYSVDKCLEILQKDMNMEEAGEFFFYNVIGSVPMTQENMPIFIYLRDD